MPESDTNQIEWVDCPACVKPAGLLRGLTYAGSEPKQVGWCDLCCHCLEAKILGDINIRPECLTEAWHAERGNRVGYVEAGADVRHALRPPSFEEYQRLCAENLANVFRLPGHLLGNKIVRTP